MTSMTNDPKIRGTVEIIQLDRPASTQATRSPGSITSTVSISHGPPPPSIFDDNSDNDVPITKEKPLDRIPPPPASTAPLKFINKGENMGNQLAATPTGPKGDLNVAPGVGGGQGANKCGLTCGVLLGVGGVALVALFGVLAVVGYKRRSKDQQSDMENSVHPLQQRSTLKAPPRRKPKLYVIGPGGLRESVATEEEREKARAVAMDHLVGADPTKKGNHLI